MIQEAYVSFETAKLLKEKGFDEICRSYFIEKGGDIRYCGAPLKNNSLQESQHLRPTQQMAMRWLREVHNRYVTILTSCELDYPAFTFRIERYIKPFFFTYFQSNKVYESYEDAVEAAIKYCLTSRVNSEKEK